MSCFEVRHGGDVTVEARDTAAGRPYILDGMSFGGETKAPLPPSERHSPHCEKEAPLTEEVEILGRDPEKSGNFSGIIA